MYIHVKSFCPFKKVFSASKSVIYVGGVFLLWSVLNLLEVFHFIIQVSVTLHKPLTDEERLNLRLERFPPIPAEERRRVIQVALESVL